MIMLAGLIFTFILNENMGDYFICFQLTVFVNFCLLQITRSIDSGFLKLEFTFG